MSRAVTKLTTMKIPVYLLSGCLWLSTAHAAINIDFNAETLNHNPNGYLGGWFTPQVGFENWVGDSTDIRIRNGKIRCSTTNGTRHGAIVYRPTSLFGAGEYTLTFDATVVAGASQANNNGHVGLWAGSGYTLGRGNANALIIDTQNCAVTPSGNASSTELIDFSFNSSLVEHSISFTYDGSSALILMLGAATTGWPFPVVKYDSVRIEAIPEVNYFALSLAGGFVAFALRRRI